MTGRHDSHTPSTHCAATHGNKKHPKYLPWLVHNLPQHPHSIIVAHVLKVDVIYLQTMKRGESLRRDQRLSSPLSSAVTQLPPSKHSFLGLTCQSEQGDFWVFSYCFPRPKDGIVGVKYLQEHVSWLNPAISCHSTALHDRANINASISMHIALSHYRNAQEVVFLCRDRKRNK